jgi:antitoxin component of MazEF toxin-antitoxin module
MQTKLIKIKNSFYIIIPESVVKQYTLSDNVEIYPSGSGIIINPKRKAREGWAEQLKTAIEQGELPDDELL